MALLPADRKIHGGNRQKVLFGTWLRIELGILLLDAPTQGVDVGAKAELQRQLLALAAEGTAAVASATDVDDLVACCDRVLVLRAGKIAAELRGHDITPGNVGLYH